MERAAGDCEIVFLGELPEAVASALAGSPVSRLIDFGALHRLFEGVHIVTAATSEGRTSIKVDPGWTLLDRTPDRGIQPGARTARLLRA